MDKALVDVAVLILFFNNPERFQTVFEEIRKAKPSKLFLYQDGARKNNKNDESGIMACRRIADEKIDWECEVHKWYREENLGCDPSNYISQKWAFSFVDKCIIFEDDSVPSVSFIRFCKELLDKYENDTRISMIAGLNYDEITPDIPYDYFFTSNISIWGWASWKRVIDCWEGDYDFLRDSLAVKELKALIKAHGIRKDFLRIAHRHKKTGKEYYETILSANMLLNSGLSIVPTKNMINNIGCFGDGVHYTAPLKMMPKKIQKIFQVKRYEIDFPLRHPKYVVENVPYKQRVYKLMAWNHPFIKWKRKMESFFLKIRFGDLNGIKRALINTLNGGK